MGRILNYIFAGMIFCGTAYGIEPIVNIEGPIPFSPNVESVSKDKRWNEAWKEVGKDLMELNYGRDYVRRKNMGLLEIRFEGENDKDYRVRTRKGRTVIPEDHKIDAAHVSFEPTENLKRNNGERNLDFGRENYSPDVFDDSYLK